MATRIVEFRKLMVIPFLKLLSNFNILSIMEGVIR